MRKLVPSALVVAALLRASAAWAGVAMGDSNPPFSALDPAPEVAPSAHDGTAESGATPETTAETGDDARDEGAGGGEPAGASLRDPPAAAGSAAPSENLQSRERDLEDIWRAGS